MDNEDKLDVNIDEYVSKLPNTRNRPLGPPGSERPTIDPDRIFTQTIVGDKNTFERLELEYVFAEFSYFPTTTLTISYPMFNKISEKLTMNTTIKYPFLKLDAKDGSKFTGDIANKMVETTEEQRESDLGPEEVKGKFVDEDGIIKMLNDQGDYIDIRDTQVYNDYKSQLDTRAASYIKDTDVYKNYRERAIEIDKNPTTEDNKDKTETSTRDESDRRITDPGIKADDDIWTKVSKMVKSNIPLTYPGTRALEFKKSTREITGDDPVEQTDQLYRDGTMFTKHKDIIFWSGFGILAGAFLWKTGLIKLAYGESIKGLYEEDQEYQKEKRRYRTDNSSSTPQPDYTMNTDRLIPRRQEIPQQQPIQPPLHNSTIPNSSQPSMRKYNLSSYNEDELEREVRRRRDNRGLNY